MPLNLLSECEFLGPALPEPFVQFELESQLNRLGVLPRTTRDQGHALQTSWEAYRRGLRELGGASGPIRVRNHILEPLVERLGYATLEKADAVRTREEPEAGEAGGYLFRTADGESRLRAWSTEFAADLDAPARRGAAYRYSHLRAAQRVLLAAGERVGLLTNGIELRILICDPARPDSQIVIPLERTWRRSRQAPDSYRLLLSLCGPSGTAAVPDLVDRARLMQARVTKDLRVQARQAIERFIQEVLDHPANQEALKNVDRERLARDLWREGLILVYRLLFILKMESSDDPARMFSFASTSLWRKTFSPRVALASYVRKLLDDGADTGALLEEGLRSLFRLFVAGLQCTELHVRPLGGALFGEQATPWLSRLKWGERAVAHLLDRLLWADPRRAGETRKRVHYGPLDVEDLGRVYEALLELEPGIAEEPMCRLQRQKLQVVVPVAQGERYRQNRPAAAESPAADNESDEEAEEEEEAPARGQRTRVEWIEPIRPGQFYLRVGLGRKASGSYYTPHSFVRFLVQETLGPQVAERSPSDNPNPAEILRLKVLDPAMGSGHFLVEACRFLGEKLYEAVRFCDEKALEAERRATDARSDAERHTAGQEANEWREKLLDLPDPDSELLAYLPSRAPEGEESGLSHARARALCRRLVAVHCLYGVDKNPLAVELAKLSLWLESQAEGFPLTFLDHRLLVGDSLTGPFWEHLIKLPGSQKVIEGLYDQDLLPKFTVALHEAIRYVAHLDARVGATMAEMEDKARLKHQMERALAPFRILAGAWTGGVMLSRHRSDDAAYEELVRAVGHTGDLPERLPHSLVLREMLAHGLGVDPENMPLARDPLYELIANNPCASALPYDLVFPEVFYPTGVPWGRRGFHAVIGNPPWDVIRPRAKEFFAAFDFSILSAPSRMERDQIQKRLESDKNVAAQHSRYVAGFEMQRRACEALYHHQVAIVNGHTTGGDPDSAKFFLERNVQLSALSGWTGCVVPAAFHATEGATALRRLYLDEMSLRACFSFQNKKKIFDIVTNVKFCLIVAEKNGRPADQIRCAFYLHDDSWLFSEQSQPLAYTRDFLRRTAGEYLTFLELQSPTDLQIDEICFENGQRLGDCCAGLGMRIGRELHRTDDAWRFTPTAGVIGRKDARDPECLEGLRRAGYSLVSDEDSIHQYTDHWTDPPAFLVHASRLQDKPGWQTSALYFRLFFRRIATVVDNRSFMAAVVPPGWISASPQAHRTRGRMAHSRDLALLAIINSYVADWDLRLRITATVNVFIFEGVPVPQLSAHTRKFLTHCALRLTSNHAGYESLWREQIDTMGGRWREPKPALTWPVLTTDDERWEVRAAVDAVVAGAYGLTRDQYAHILSTFSHRSYPKAPELCLAKFDDLKQIGLEAFARKDDPYWDIPLNENLPQPVIELPELTASPSPNGNEPPTNLLGEPLPTNLFGEVEYAASRRRRKR